MADVEVFAGAAGQGFALEFMGFLQIYRALPNIAQILASPTTAPVPSGPAALWAVGAALARVFTKANAAPCFAYAARLPKEFEVCLIRDAQTQRAGTKEDFSATQEFIAWATSPANRGLW